MRLSAFDYALSKDLIAQYPTEKRGASRLMVLDRKRGSIDDGRFTDLPEFFHAGDCLVLNDTKVIPARLIGKRKTGGRIEVFLLEELGGGLYCVLIRPSRRTVFNEEISFGGGELFARVVERKEPGWVVRFEADSSLKEALTRLGRVPLPPYIKRSPEAIDGERYQTVYAAVEGATAAPTAGLHFTGDLLKEIKDKGVAISSVTLHTSYGTFAPIKTEEVEAHRMHREYFEIPEEAARAVNGARKGGGGVFCVGTTTCRALEAAADGRLARAGSGYTDLYIYPGYEFKVADHLLTNFHLPKSTLLLLVAAFAGREFIMEAYRKAIELRYRFFSYGDAMLIL